MGEVAVPSLRGLSVLDAAHAESFPAFLRLIGHDSRSERNRARASAALTGLRPSLQSNEGPNYSDPYVAAAYLVEYHLEHVMLAYWAFRGLFDQVGVPESLYVLDVAAGTGASRVGLAIALAELRRDFWPTVHFDSFDTSMAMLAAGDCFWQSLGEKMPWVRDFKLRDFGALPARKAIPAGPFRIVTGFHPTLPYDSVWWGESSGVMGSIKDALGLVSPQAELFSCFEKKSSALSSVLAGFSGAPEEFSAPDSLWNLGGNSSIFYDRVAVEQGFQFAAGKTSVTRRGGYRFGFPKDSVLYKRISPSEREERSRQQRSSARESFSAAQEVRRAREERQRTEARLIREAEQRPPAAAPQPKLGFLKRISRILFS